MSEPHDKRREKTSKIIITTAIFVSWLFLTASFLSYTPMDLPTKFVYHDLQEIRNLAGLPGAWCAYIVSFCFGVAGYFLVIGSGLAVAAYFFSSRINEPYNKALGFFLTLVAASGLAAYIFNSSIGPPVGPGGMVGAFVKFIFDKFFIRFGAYAALGAMFFSGMILILPEKILRFIFWSTRLGSVVGRVFRPFLERIQRANPQRPVTNARVIARDNASALKQRQDSVRVYGSSPFAASENAPVTRRPASAVKPAGFTVQASQTLDSVEVNELYMDANTSGAILSDATKVEPLQSPYSAPPTRSESSNEISAPYTEEEKEYLCPPIDLLDVPEQYDVDEISEQIRERGDELERVCRNYGVELKVVDIQTGPVLTLYEVELQKGLRVKALHNLANDLEIAMKAPRVSIVSPIPGKNTVGIEIPNKNRHLVRLREVMESCVEEAQSATIPVFLGKDVVGAPMVADLSKLPHLLIAGRTGTGKSVCLNSIIMSIIMTKSPKEVRFIMIDPKMVELSPYHSIPHLMHPVVTDMQKAEAILEWAVERMEERYRLFARVGVRQLSEFNELNAEALRKRLRPVDADEWEAFPKSMPNIVIIADEMADLVMTSGKDVERHIARLAQKSRAVGIHLVLATQKPTVDVVTGLIKSNLPARISFAVASRVDSQVVLDMKGAERLLGDGDMLFLLPGTSQLVRGQGAFVSNREIDSVIEAISVDKPHYEIVIADRSSDGENMDDATDIEYDEFFVPAVDTVIEAGRASTSMLQRKFSIGYTRAARIIDTMTRDGLVSEYNPSKPSRPRDVLITMEEWRGKQQNLAGSSSDSYSNAESEPATIPYPTVARSKDDKGKFHESASQRDEEESDHKEPNASSDGQNNGWTDEQWEQYLNYGSELSR